MYVFKNKNRFTPVNLAHTINTWQKNMCPTVAGLRLFNRFSLEINECNTIVEFNYIFLLLSSFFVYPIFLSLPVLLPFFLLSLVVSACPLLLRLASDVQPFGCYSHACLHDSVKSTWKNIMFLFCPTLGTILVW